MKTKVAFRMIEGEVIALFPAEVADYRGGIMSYMLVGQHGSASRQLLRNKRATGEQYTTLLAELTSIGYDVEVIP